MWKPGFPETTKGPKPGLLLLFLNGLISKLYHRENLMIGQVFQNGFGIGRPVFRP